MSIETCYKVLEGMNANEAVRMYRKMENLSDRLQMWCVIKNKYKMSVR